MQKMQNNNIYEKKADYDPTKYLPDPEHPELICPIEDWEAPNRGVFEMHVLTNHDLEDIVPYLVSIQYSHWRFEQIIRKLTGRPAYEIVVAEDATRP